MAGTEGDGKWTLLAGVAAALLAFIDRRPWQVKAIFLVAAGLAILAAIGTRANIDDYHDEFGDIARASIGWGLWLTLAAAVVGSVLSFVRTDAETTKLPDLPPPGSSYYRGPAG